jgi:S-adenosylmethionine decarboxylase
VINSTVLEAIPLGTEWIVDAYGCDPASLRSSVILVRLFARVVEEMDLHPTNDAVWHVFPGPGGITGVLLLSESHLTCHTFPERGFAAFNLYSCRPAQEWPWADRLKEALGATRVTVRALARGDVSVS